MFLRNSQIVNNGLGTLCWCLGAEAAPEGKHFWEVERTPGTVWLRVPGRTERQSAPLLHCRPFQQETAALYGRRRLLCLRLLLLCHVSVATEKSQLSPPRLSFVSHTDARTRIGVHFHSRDLRWLTLITFLPKFIRFEIFLCFSPGISLSLLKKPHPFPPVQPVPTHWSCLCWLSRTSGEKNKKENLKMGIIWNL